MTSISSALFKFFKPRQMVKSHRRQLFESPKVTKQKPFMFDFKINQIRNREECVYDIIRVFSHCRVATKFLWRFWERAAWYWILDFVDTLGGNNRLIYMTLCSQLVWGWSLDTWSLPSIVNDWYRFPIYNRFFKALSWKNLQRIFVDTLFTRADHTSTKCQLLWDRRWRVGVANLWIACFCGQGSQRLFGLISGIGAGQCSLPLLAQTSVATKILKVLEVALPLKWVPIWHPSAVFSLFDTSTYIFGLVE